MRTPATAGELNGPMVGTPKRSEGERSEPERSGGAPTMGATPSAIPNAKPEDPEVVAKPARRRFSAEYKLRILREADRCTKSGEMGSLLRREGLYSSLLTTWRRQQERGSLMALAARKRGRKPKKADPMAHKVAQLERENLRLQGRLKQAQTIIEVQKKVSEILGIPLKSLQSEGNV